MRVCVVSKAQLGGQSASSTQAPELDSGSVLPTRRVTKSLLSMETTKILFFLIFFVLDTRSDRVTFLCSFI